MYLASRIDDLSRIVLVLVLDHLAERILDGRVVAVDKVPVDELHRQTRLACAPSRQYAVCWYLHVKPARASGNHVPTALLPTMATFLCLGGGAILLLGLGRGREEAERLARFEVWLSQSTAAM